MESWKKNQMSLWLTIISMMIGMSYGQTVNLTGPASVVEGRDAIFTCNVTGILFPTFVWNDVSVTPSQQIFVNFGSFSEKPKYDNFKLSQSGNSTIMTIREADFEDAGSFVCVASGVNSATIKFTIDDSPWFGHPRSFIVIAALAILLVASIIINISQYIK